MKKNEGKTTDWLSEQSIVFGCYIWFFKFLSFCLYRPAHGALTKVIVNVGAKVNMWRDPAKGSKKGSQRNN